MDLTYHVAPTGMWAAAEFATVLLCCTFPTFPRFISWVRSSKEKTRLGSLQYSDGSSQARRLRTLWGEKTMDTRIGSSVEMWEGLEMGRNDGGKESRETLGVGVPARVVEGGIWRSVEIETRSVRIDV